MIFVATKSEESNTKEYADDVNGAGKNKFSHKPVIVHQKSEHNLMMLRVRWHIVLCNMVEGVYVIVFFPFFDCAWEKFNVVNTADSILGKFIAQFQFIDLSIWQR